MLVEHRCSLSTDQPHLGAQTQTPFSCAMRFGSMRSRDLGPHHWCIHPTLMPAKNHFPFCILGQLLPRGETRNEIPIYIPGSPRCAVICHRLMGHLHPALGVHCQYAFTFVMTPPPISKQISIHAVAMFPCDPPPSDMLPQPLLRPPPSLHLFLPEGPDDGYARSQTLTPS
jgi:hypothetical protein